MLHRNRCWSVTPVESAEALAEKLTQHNWTGCTGFRFGDVLYLNDSTSADGAQEYAVVDALTGWQFESVTFGWCSEAKALEIIRRYAAGQRPEPWDIEDWRVHCEPRRAHSCWLCA